MFEKKVLYFNATEFGEKIDVPEPVEENIYGKAIHTIIGWKGEPVGIYGVEYHLAYIEEGILTFEGKQDDFFYSFSMPKKQTQNDFVLDKNELIKSIQELEYYFSFRWLRNDASITDEHGIKRNKKNLLYDIEISDNITLRVSALAYNCYDDGIHDMIELCNRINNNEFKLQII